MALWGGECTGGPQCCWPTKHDSLERPRGARGRCCRRSPRRRGVRVPGGRYPQPPWSGRDDAPRHCGEARSWGRVGVQRGAQTDYLCFASASGPRVAGTGLERGDGGWTWGSRRQMGLRPQPHCRPSSPPPPATGWAGDSCPARLAAFPIGLLPSLFSRQRGADPPQPSAPPYPAAAVQGIEPQTPFACHRAGSTPLSRTPGTPIPSPWEQPCLALGPPRVTFLHDSSATCMCRRGGGPRCLIPLPKPLSCHQK